jgi:hypothetical protein
MAIKETYILKRLTLLPGFCYLASALILFITENEQSNNTLISILWCLGQLGILAILYFIFSNELNGKSLLAKMSLGLPSLGAISYLTHHILHHIFNIDSIKLFLPLGALLTGVGMCIVGVQIVVFNKWSGWQKITPLLTGLYPFLIMFPLLIVTGHPSIYAIMFWGLPWLLVGVTINSQALSEKNQY